MAKTNIRRRTRLRRKKHIRKKLFGTTGRPRLSVFRSSKHIYVQIIDDVSGSTLASASTLSKELNDTVTYGGNKSAAQHVGTLIANRAKEKGISSVVFDRNGFLYHGRVASLATAARAAGLNF
jgi:large subunit ribosomal protein L18